RTAMTADAGRNARFSRVARGHAARHRNPFTGTGFSRETDRHRPRTPTDGTASNESSSFFPHAVQHEWHRQHFVTFEFMACRVDELPSCSRWRNPAGELSRSARHATTHRCRIAPVSGRDNSSLYVLLKHANH